jgi:hypothetical protein
MPDFLCEERLKLTRLYLDDVAMNQAVSRTVADEVRSMARSYQRNPRNVLI